MIEQFYDLRPEVLALDRKALSLCREQFAHVEEIRDYNQLKMLRAFTDGGAGAGHSALYAAGQPSGLCRE